ncbi:uncharacterized protein BX663DRAFT_434326, partial [Cokeromyces recurvatus]
STMSYKFIMEDGNRKTVDEDGNDPMEIEDEEDPYKLDELSSYTAYMTVV